MKTLFVFPFLALFGVPLAWATNAWHSHPFVSGMTTESKIHDDSFASTASVAAHPLTHERTRLPRMTSYKIPMHPAPSHGTPAQRPVASESASTAVQP